MDLIGKMRGLHPFEVFPEEVWPSIAEQLEDSKEILNLIEAIPEIREVMESRKRRWIFDQVIPKVSRYLGREDVLTCRQVCKQWSHGVDNFMEHHPLLRAYDHQTHVTGQIWVHQGFPSMVIQFYAPSLGNFPRLLVFRSVEKINSFLKAVGKYPESSWSPIVGRSLYFHSRDEPQLYTRASEVISSIGNHVWFLGILGPWNQGPLALCKSTKEWLGQLPNLKSLGLRLMIPPGGEGGNENGGAEPDADANEEPDPGLEQALERSLEQLPPLPHLETLEFCLTDELPLPLTHALVRSYSLQIRRLWMEFRYWRTEYFTIFPELTELYVTVPHKQAVIDLLFKLESPLLYTLVLNVGNDPDSLQNERDVLPVLKRFPLLRNLAMGALANPIATGRCFSLETDVMPSVKYLNVEKGCLHTNSDFLLCFPNLEYIYLNDGLLGAAEGPAHEPTLRIWESILNGRMYESTLWELLPKLRVLTLRRLEGDAMVDIQFKRETYEYGMIQAQVEAEEAN